MSHDASMLKRGATTSEDELKVSRRTVPVLAAVAIALGIIFEEQNVAFMVSLAFVLAASGNFPVLLMSVLWRGCTTRGVVVGGSVGAVLALVLTVLSPAIWVTVLGHATPIYPFNSPTIFSMPLAFLTIWLFSITDRSGRAVVDRSGYDAQRFRSETGIGAATASNH